ncbi:protein kinase domain-containing protein [Prosthecobacter sp.]|uniref:serine/threonine-protein kinase n=1 Tax=Prosthecobacter sp. TaxID=1965333 RepID=UPI003783547B
MTAVRPSTEPATCPECSALLETDGVCLTCVFSDALHASDDDTQEAEGLKERAFSTLGRLVLPCEFAGHRLLRELGGGGMGLVFEAEDLRLKRKVALKMIRAAAFARPEEMARFRTEAEMAAGLDHAGIVPIYEIGSAEEDVPFFTMKLIAGESLAQRLARQGKAKPARRAAELVAKVARAVQHAHTRGVLHRDLKPANILMDENGEPHLTDFGLAKLLDDDLHLTRTTAHLGTPHYMSPEQAAGRTREVTTASDVWALGVLLFQLLTLRLPYRGESSQAVMQAIQEAGPVPMTGVEPDLATLIMRCMEKEPAKRLASAGFLAEELERWMRGEVIVSRPAGVGEQVWKWMLRHRTATLALFGVLLAVCAGGGAALWQWRQAVKARDVAQRELADAGAVTDLLTNLLLVFDEKRGGPVSTKQELLTEFLKKVENFEGDPQRQINLIIKTGTLLDQADNSRCYRRAAEIAERTFAPDDPQIWYLRWRAASTAPGGSGQADWVNPELRRVYEWHRDHLGPEHPSTQMVMHSLAKRIIARGGHVEALGMLEQIRDSIRRHPDEAPPVSVVMLGIDYMSALIRNGRVEEGLEAGRESCRVALAKLETASSHEAARACHVLAQCARKAGKAQEAIGHARKALEVFWRYEGPATEDAMLTLTMLLNMLQAQGDGAGALALQHEALLAFDMALGPARKETQQQVARYADLLVKADRRSDANALYEQWLNRLRNSEGRLVPEAAELERAHAEHLQKTGR